MKRLSERLEVSCRKCNHRHIPIRISGRFHDEKRTRVYIWKCRECGHLWEDSIFKKTIK